MNDLVRIKDIVSRVDRVNDFYSVGPVQRAAIEEFAQRIIEQYSYNIMDVVGASPEHIAFVAKQWGVEL